MSRWSNPFVSLGLGLILAACQGTPATPRATARETLSSTAAAGMPAGDPPEAAAASPAGGDPAPAPATGGGKVAAAKASTGGVAGLSGSAPIPPRAAQQYAVALKLMKAGQTSEAELEFKQLTVAYPDLAGPYLNLGLLYLQSSRLPDAEAAFETARERNPASAIAGNELGIAERKLGKFAEAEAAYRRTIAVEPNYAPAYLNLGVLYDLYLGEPQKALAQFEHYIELAGENKQVAGWVVELRKRAGAAAPVVKKEPA